MRRSDTQETLIPASGSDQDRAERARRSTRRKFQRRHVQNWIWLTVTAVAGLALFRPTPHFSNSGMETGLDLSGWLLLLLGLAVRVAARGWKHEAPGRNLVTDGPYGYVRHPLYVGSFLIGIGLCAIAGSGPLTVVFCLCFGLSHAAAIRREEATLERKWPADFARYRSRVGALWPRPDRFRFRERIWPRRPWEALAREADALCLWLVAAAALQFWEVALGDRGLRHHRTEAAVMTTLAILLGLGWYYLRSQTQKMRARIELTLP